MSIQFKHVITATLAAISIAANASAIKPNLVTKEGLVLGSIDNVSRTNMKLTVKEILHGSVKEMNVPSQITSNGTAVYSMILSPDTQIRLTYQNEKGDGCRITFASSDLYTGDNFKPLIVSHDIAEITSNSDCDSSWETDNFMIDTYR